VGDVECRLTVTSNRRIPVKHTFGSSVVFCQCQIIELFPVLFYVVSAVHKFEFRLVTNETPNKWRQVFVKKKATSCSDRDSFLLALLFYPSDVASVTDSTEVTCVFSSKGQYVSKHSASHHKIQH
jgi:hypothetical protein